MPGLYANKEDNYYNAFEKDIAVVHFFFQVRLHAFFITRPWAPSELVCRGEEETNKCNVSK